MSDERKPVAGATVKKEKPPRGSASLYPLDPETAIRAIMETGPYSKGEPGTVHPKRRRTVKGQ